jgi:radical SAM superfamily enzyme YgiQ (UPF0313 family)
VRALLVSGSFSPDQPPTGLLTLATIARDKGWTVGLAQLPSRQNTSAFLARAADADIVGFTTTCSTYPRILLLAAMLKARAPKVPIVLGGPQATSTAEATVTRHQAIDLIVRGEAETAWPQLLNEIAHGAHRWERVPGAVWRTDAGVIEQAKAAPLIGDLDGVPLPALDLVLPRTPIAHLAVEVGRGCPYGCTFCSTNTFFRRRFRMKSVSRILQDLTTLADRYGVRHFDFIHDMFTVRREAVEEIAGALQGRGITWNCSARTDRLDEPLLRLMAAAGCSGIYAGIETGSQLLQHATKKNLSVADAICTVRRCQMLGLGVTASLIFGYPNETLEDLRDTLLCYFELLSPHPAPQASGPLVPQLHLFAPLADTQIVDPTEPYAFDPRLSSTVRSEVDSNLWPEEIRMVQSDFELFSAFYRPQATPYRPQDYLALDALFMAIHRWPQVRAHLAGPARLPFVDYLLRGGFEPPSVGEDADGAAAAIVLGFATQRPQDGALALASEADGMIRWPFRP